MNRSSNSLRPISGVLEGIRLIGQPALKSAGCLPTLQARAISSATNTSDLPAPSHLVPRPTTIFTMLVLSAPPSPLLPFFEKPCGPLLPSASGFPRSKRPRTRRRVNPVLLPNRSPVQEAFKVRPYARLETESKLVQPSPSHSPFKKRLTQGASQVETTTLQDTDLTTEPSSPTWADWDALLPFHPPRPPPFMLELEARVELYSTRSPPRHKSKARTAAERQKRHAIDTMFAKKDTAERSRARKRLRKYVPKRSFTPTLEVLLEMEEGVVGVNRVMRRSLDLD